MGLRQKRKMSELHITTTRLAVAAQDNSCSLEHEPQALAVLLHYSAQRRLRLHAELWHTAQGCFRARHTALAVCDEIVYSSDDMLLSKLMEQFIVFQ